MRHEKINAEKIKEIFNYKEYEFFDEKVNIICIRNDNFGFTEYEDLLIVCDALDCKTYNVTSEPSYWLQNPKYNIDDAVLVPGQYIDSWEYDEGQLKQCKPVDVWKTIGDDVKIVEGNFGLNIHYPGNEIIESDLTSSVMFKNRTDYTEFLDFIDRSLEIGDTKFTLTLLEEEDLEGSNVIEE